MRQLKVAMSLGAVAVLVGPAAAWSIDFDSSSVNETVGHHNQDRPAWLHHNQDNVVPPPYFEIPEPPPDSIHDPPGWIGIQDDGRRRSHAPPIGAFGAELDLILLGETSGPGDSNPKTAVASPISAMPGGASGFGGSIDDFAARTRDVALPGASRPGGAAVPTPGALSLLGLAALGLMGHGRRRRLSQRPG